MSPKAMFYLPTPLPRRLCGAFPDCPSTARVPTPITSSSPASRSPATIRCRKSSRRISTWSSRSPRAQPPTQCCDPSPFSRSQRSRQKSTYGLSLHCRANVSKTNTGVTNVVGDKLSIQGLCNSHCGPESRVCPRPLLSPCILY